MSYKNAMAKFDVRPERASSLRRQSFKAATSISSEQRTTFKARHNVDEPGKSEATPFNQFVGPDREGNLGHGTGREEREVRLIEWTDSNEWVDGFD